MELPALEGATHRTVSARGLDFHVAEAGAGAGDPIVLVHGWPEHWWAWRHVVPLLAPHARLVMPDLRGFGWSSAPSDGYDKQTMADDVLAVLDALGLGRVRLIGHDWGSWIGFLACLAAPERFAAFLALSSPTPMGRPSPRQLLQIWRFAYQLVLAAPAVGERLIGSEAFIQRLMRAGAADPGVWTQDDLHVFSGVLAEPPRARASVALYRTFLLHEAGRAPSGRLRVPTRILSGEKDHAIPPVLFEGAEREGDDVTVEILAGCGHFVPEERPQVVAERALALFGLGAAA
jgi:pimeloyl-ACP methyl ester carboxylesterase